MMSDIVALIDDTDAETIKYNGQWSILAGGAELGYDSQTLHGSQVAGSTATITFQGSGISVFGNLDPPELSGVLPNVTYSLDGSTPTPYPPPTAPTQGQTPPVKYRQKLYSSPQVPDGRHTLVITLQNNLSSSSYWLDYVLLVPSPQTLPSVETIIDDRDSTGKIVYNPPSSWIQTPGVQQEFESTTTFSNTPNTAATIQFKGTYIYLVGTVAQDIGNAQSDASFSTSIDSGPPIVHPLPIINFPALYNVPLFDSGNLVDGPHTLTVTVLNNRSLHLDYFLLKQSALPNTLATSGISTSTSVPSATKAKPNVGAIAGGAVVGLVALAAIALVVVFRLRRKKQRFDAAARPAVGMLGGSAERISWKAPLRLPPSASAASSLPGAGLSRLDSSLVPSCVIAEPSRMSSKTGRIIGDTTELALPFPSAPGAVRKDFAPPPYV